VFRKWGLAFILCAVSTQATAATKNILITGFWPPTNEMIRRLNRNPVQNPEGWLGHNYKNSGFDVYAYFPEFPQGTGRTGTGDFRVDFASAYNDFMRYTIELQPIAVVSFGAGAGPWEIEATDVAVFQKMFESGNIPSNIGQAVRYPIPDSLKAPIEYRSSLPMELIRDKVNTTGGPSAWIDQNGAGTFLCAFMAYLGGWYHHEHRDPRDPAYNAMAGFIHVSALPADATQAVDATLEAIFETLEIGSHYAGN
jgi:pyrrolidone-carboxylate peptidase